MVNNHKSFNWGNLVTHLGSSEASFEALSKQLFRREYQGLGVYQDIGMPGQSQGGVEAVVVLENGDEIGMQSKWFPAKSGSIKTSGRRKQIESSLKLATEKRPNLKKWVLYSPTEFDTNDWTWWKKLKSKYPSILVEQPQLGGKIVESLGDDKNFGMRSWFFGDLEFNKDNFEKLFKIRIESISNKYKPAMHVSGDADLQIRTMLGHSDLAESLGKEEAELNKVREKITGGYATLREEVIDPNVLSLVDGSVGHWKSFNDDLDRYDALLKQFISLIKNGDISSGKHFEFPYMEDVFSDLFKSEGGYKLVSLIKDMSEMSNEKATLSLQVKNMTLSFGIGHGLGSGNNFTVDYDKDKKIFNILVKNEFMGALASNLLNDIKKKHKVFRDKSVDQLITQFIDGSLAGFCRDLEKISGRAGEVISLTEELLSISGTIHGKINVLKAGKLIFLADRGIGKTHLLAQACEKHLSDGNPAILILGSQILDRASLKKQVMDLLDIPSGFTWVQVVQFLDSYAEAHKVRLLFAFDALNESRYWESVVKEGLEDLLAPMLNSDWIGVAMSCRKNHAVPLFGLRYPKNHYELENDMDIEEYRRTYFKEYKIKVVNQSPSMRQHLYDRYFVTLLCQVYGNPTADKPIEISLEKVEVNDLLERYLAKVDDDVCIKLQAHTGCRFVREKLIRLCGYMFDNHLTHVTKLEALRIVEDTEPAKVRTDDSWLGNIVDTGLLVDVDWREGGEIVEFSHQRLAEYLMALYVVENRKPETVKDLLRLHVGHSRILDILELVATLLPTHVNKHLYQLLPGSNQVELAQAEAFFEMDPSKIGQQDVEWVTKYFSRTSSDSKKNLLSKLMYSSTFEKYPFNADYSSKLLRNLSLKDRDLLWTEWCRHSSSFQSKGVFGFVDQFEELVKENDFPEGRLALGAVYIKWFLTSTDRELRDRATRALYWYGISYPKALFDLTIDSLDINDPYVPERLLAASYGVLMADYSQRKLTSEILSNYGRALYLHMFCLGAKNSTTHLLMRDYARRSIELIQLQRSKILTKSEEKRIKPPFKMGGIRKWAEMDDSIDGRKYGYDKCPHPFGFDWGNYTLGRIVPGRSPYQDTKEFIKVKRQVFWRINDLGFDPYSFAEIDKDIASSDRSYRSNIPGKTERYGKKYAWIAFYELAGLRADKGLLREEWPIRGSDVDVDPSFPEEQEHINLVNKSFIDTKVGLKKWVNDKSPLPIGDLLAVDVIGDKPGRWVLLDGFMSEENRKVNKGVTVRVSGVLVDSNNSVQLKKLYENKKPIRERDSDIPDPESDYYTYAGEIPWCETFPFTQYPQEMTFHTSSKKIVKEVRKMPIIRFLTGLDLGDKENKMMDTESTYEVLDEEEMIRQGIIVKIPVLIPVRHFSWEGYHSNLNQSGGVTVVNKEISVGLGLRIQPRAFNLLDESGQQASYTLENGSPWTNGSSFAYLRKDLLDKYLSMNKKSLVWLVWGERQIETTDKDYSREELTKFQTKYGKTYIRYEQALIYS